jgi:hypothetical protein
MFSYFLFKRIVLASAASLIDIFVYKSEPVLPFYNTDLECNNNASIGKRCLDADMDSVFFV